MSAVDSLLASVEWKPTGLVQTDEMPVATHVGTFNLAGCEMKCYVLSTGQRVFDADSMERFFGVRA